MVTEVSQQTKRTKASFAGRQTHLRPEGAYEVMSRSQELEAKRHDIVHLEAVHCVKPQGAFYAFPNIQETGKLPQEIVNLFLGFGVALLPRSAFGKYGEGCLRLSYANSIPNIQRALMRMDKALNSIN